MSQSGIYGRSDVGALDRSLALPARLTFFTELEAAPLAALFSKRDVVDRLVALKATVSMGILDFCDERARVVRELNVRGVPVVAWQLLSKEKGYWYHLNNAPDAVERYEQFCEWTQKEGLQWDAIGIDIEPDINEVQQLLRHDFRTLSAFLKRIWNKEKFAKSCAIYASLVARMRADGYEVQSYECFFMADERKVGSSLLNRIFGLASVPADKRVAMLYSSYFGPVGVGVLGIYARAADAAAIGITGGGVELEGLRNKEPMTWDEFSRDLRIANSCCGDVHIFSLEGCEERGYLGRLSDFDWSKKAACPLLWSALLSVARWLALGALWLFAHPAYLVAAAAALLLWNFLD
ncbi:MAG: hypothetical protein WBM67_00730 [Sedimenticolaceae bacterium]